MTSTVFDINNQGIHYLQQGSYEEAAQTFQFALARLRDLLYRNIKPDPSSRCQCNDNEEVCIVVSVSSHPKGIENDMCSFQQNGNSFALYDHAFTVPYSSTQDESEILASADTENLASASLLYNLALVYHKRGLATGKSKDLQRALSLYEKAATLVENVEIGQDERRLVLILALLNNMGYIHAEQFEIQEATCCMDSIRMIMESDESHEYLGEEQHDFFYWHLFLFPERPVWLAPAA